VKNPCLASRGLGIVLAAALTVVILGVPRAGAQVSPTLESYLRVEFTVEPSKGGRLRLSGYVYNTWDKWATDVRLSAEALDDGGQVVGSTAVAVYGKVPPGNRSYFDVPLTTAGARYRVTVRSVEWRTYGAGGG
jgi:hypothetical protein